MSKNVLKLNCSVESEVVEVVKTKSITRLTRADKKIRSLKEGLLKASIEDASIEDHNDFDLDDKFSVEKYGISFNAKATDEELDESINKFKKWIVNTRALKIENKAKIKTLNELMKANDIAFKARGLERLKQQN